MGSIWFGKAALTVFLLAQAGAAAAAEVSTPTDRQAADRRAYMSAGCYQCHGTVGQGGVAPRLAPQPPSLAALTAFVRNSPRNMPAYDTRVLSDGELQQIGDYLASVEAGPAPGQIRQLNP